MDEFEVGLEDDLALLEGFGGEEAIVDDLATDAATDEATGLDYYYNIMLPELQEGAFTDAEKIDFMVKVLSA